jgi:hypothetical integral membrane protein (TIGR02206 family)
MARVHPVVFGLAHIFWLTGIGSTAALVSFLRRRKRIPARPLRAVLACLLAGCEIQRYIHDGLAWPNGLPLQICNLTAWIAVLACLSLTPLAVECTYFWGIAGAGMALFTPDFGAQWPPRFFITHGALVITACVLAYGRISPLRAGAMWRAYRLCVLYAVLTGIFDWLFGANYAYLRGKPESFTTYNWMGPWPWYLISLAWLAAALFWLLWLPVRPVSRSAALPEVCASAGRR